MKYSIALASLLAAASAQSVAKTVVEGLTTDTNSLKTTIDSYNGGDASALTSASTKIVTSITDGDAKVLAAPDLTQGEAIDLANSVQALGTSVKSAVDAIVGKKPTLVSAGQGPAALSALQAQQSASSKFSTDLTGKIPAALQPIASSLAAPIASALSSGVAAFADQTGGAGSASATATSAGSSAATSASSQASSATSAASSAATSAATTSKAASTTAVATASAKPTTIVTGAADKMMVGSGMAAAAFLAVLAL